VTISTSLLFDRSVQLMAKQQGELANIQQRVATGKELIRPSDSPELAVNIARIKSTIGQLDAYKNSLNSVNDRLRIEESYLEGAKDVLIKMKQLTIQAANGAISNSDRQVIAVEMDELVSETVNLANGTDANGNFLFGGSRVSTPPYQTNDQGIIEYLGDNYRPSLDYTANRRSQVGRNGLDVFTPILSGNQAPSIPGVYAIQLSGTHEVDDTYVVEVDGHLLERQVLPGETADELIQGLADQLNQLSSDGDLKNIVAESKAGFLQITALDGIRREIKVSAINGQVELNEFHGEISANEEEGTTVISLMGDPERGDRLAFGVGTRTIEYVVTGAESDPLTREAVTEALKDKIRSSGLFGDSIEVEIDPEDASKLVVNSLRPVIGSVSFSISERQAINDQTVDLLVLQEPIPELPERIEFFEALGDVVSKIRSGSQDEIQSKLHQLDQMLDTLTLSMADIGAEMSSIADEIDVNESLKVELQTTLSSKEDLDFTTAITRLQSRMMSLEAAQSSFAKISQLSLFDYLR